MSEPDNTGPGLGQGGGEQGERIEGSLTSGGSIPGATPEDRAFGAGSPAAEPGRTEAQGEGGGAMSGRGQEEAGEPGETGTAGPSGEQSGYGNTPPR
jgi:hypothetical protein